MGSVSIRCFPGAFATVLVLALTACSDTGGDDESTYPVWTNEEGRSMEAVLTGYDYEDKTVQWRLPNGRSARSPLAELDDASQWRALARQPFWRDVGRHLEETGDPDLHARLRDFEKKIELAILPLCLLVIVLDFLAHKFAVRMLTEPGRDAWAYLQLLGAALFLLIAFGVVLAVATPAVRMVLENVNPPGEEPTVVVALVYFAGIFAVFLVATLAAMSWIVARHYRCGGGRALGVVVLRGVLSAAFVIAVELAVAGTAFLMRDSLAPLVDPLLLRPLDLA